MYLFVYKTTHKNGKFYIGRHQTSNLEDGYFGSGKWVKSIKDKSNLTREILEEANSIEGLMELEEHYINLYWEDPLCMNYLKSSMGFSSKDASKLVQKRIKDGTHNFLKEKDGNSVSKTMTQKRIKDGSHNFLKRKDGSSLGKTNCQNMLNDGTHPFLRRKDGSSVASDMIKNKTHPFLTRKDGSSLSSDMVKTGTHNFLKRSDGSSIQTDRVKNGSHNLLGPKTNAKRLEEGTHNFLKNKNLIACYNKTGEYIRISKETYYSQSGPKIDWEYVTVRSKEGKSRKL